MKRGTTSTAALDGRRYDRHHHAVELYESDEFLVDSVCEFVEPALLAGDAVVVVATEAHRQKFADELVGRGIDVRGARARGQYIARDAAGTLLPFMVDGRPDPTRFVQTLGPLIDQATDGGRQVRVYGEMVAVLWSDGNAEAAIALEDLWNDLAASHAFSLLCAYPMGAFAGEANTAPFRRMCQKHTRVMPTERYAKLTDPEDQLYALALLQQEAEASTAENAALRAQQAQLLAAAREVATALDDSLNATWAMSHDIRAPIDEVSGLSALLLDTPLTDGQRVLAHGVRTAGDDVARIIEDIRDFARLEAGGIELDVAELHVGQLVEDAETVMTEPARARGLELLAHCDPALPLPRRGDGRRLRRVLLNLVSNAVRFTEEGEVVIRAQPAAGGQVRFEVVDTAEGTVPEERAWLLAGFVRADSVTTRPHAGTGLGLSVSRRLVEAMGGRTGVETSGRGSTVWFTVPLPVDWFKVPLAVAPDTIAPG